VPSVDRRGAPGPDLDPGVDPEARGLLFRQPRSVTPTRTARTGALLALLWVAWLLVPAGLVLAAIGEVLTFLGQQPTAAERVASDRYLLAAAVTVVCLPVAGIVLSAALDRRVSAVAFSVALGVGLLLSVPVLRTFASGPAPSVVPSHPGGCQEHSGGDARCPGG
jgi:hypothetical protein